ncbi:MAG: hypothetical protein ACRC33_25385 [Gemmataceae bacterium]
MDTPSACGGWPEALRDLEPAVTSVDTECDVANLTDSLQELYDGWAFPEGELDVPGIDGALRAIFDDGEGTPAADLIRRAERDLLANVYRWTGHFPERTRQLLRHLAGRAEALNQAVAPGREPAVRMGLATFVTALAMNHVRHGSYLT